MSTAKNDVNEYSSEVQEYNNDSDDAKSVTKVFSRGFVVNDQDDQLTLEKQSEDHNGPNPFLDPVVAKYYKDLYNSTKYECRHQFDPTFSWDKEEEKVLVRKLDLRVTLLACVMFAALNIDRSNLGQAVADHLLVDLGMTNTQYNKGNTIFYLSFLCAELPSQLISKRIGPDRWIPIQITLWSIVSLAQFKMNASYFYAARCLLGLLQGGFIPDLVLWMSYFWTAAELSIRLAWFWTALSITKIVTAILAWAFFHLEGKGGIYGWGWVFLIEGLITLVIGFASFFLMVPSSVQTKRPWNKKGWFTDREEKIIVNRVLRDDPSKGDMHNRQGLSFKMIFAAVGDYYLWPIYLIGLLEYIPCNTVGTYLTLILEDLGYTVFQANLLSIPSTVLEIIILLSITWLSERVHSIFSVSLLAPIWAIPLLAVLRWWPGSGKNAWGSFAVLSLILATPYIHAMMVSACSRNSQSVRSRTVSASLYNMFVQAGSIISSNLYQTADKPYYHKGNEVLFAIAVLTFPLIAFTGWFYKTINKRRTAKWDALTKDEQEEYIRTTKDVGSRRLNFRFAY